MSKILITHLTVAASVQDVRETHTPTWPATGTGTRSSPQRPAPSASGAVSTALGQGGP
jgi:hypothetical protein